MEREPREVELVGGPHDGPTNYCVGSAPPETLATALVPCACGSAHVEVWEPYEVPPVPTVEYVLADENEQTVTYVYDLPTQETRLLEWVADRDSMREPATA